MIIEHDPKEVPVLLLVRRLQITTAIVIVLLFLLDPPATVAGIILTLLAFIGTALAAVLVHQKIKQP
ncbi:MAG: hypothetical protein NTV54_12025 [Ignavibacteriales bacterium]|nr:hypothetical protein [Ignavibacteriales bacterium]